MLARILDRAPALGITFLLLAFVPACAPSAEDDEDVVGDESSTVEGEEASGSALSASQFPAPTTSPAEREAVLAKYSELDPGHVIPHALLRDAVAFYDHNRSRLGNRSYLAVVDFARRSGDKRLFVVDMNRGSVAAHVVAHGSGSDPANSGLPTRFSNVKDSNQSSLGYYVTGEVYSGKHGRSLRLDGVSPTNSNARARAVVVHGADYVSEGRARQGRSWGCLAVSPSERSVIIAALEGGSVIYAARAE
ncbi:MAG: hypothetical protein JWP97_5635 [Labilithrix sp.]|nr:hypothetical protein [Labilithrix sp.]